MTAQRVVHVVHVINRIPSFTHWVMSRFDEFIEQFIKIC